MRISTRFYALVLCLLIFMATLSTSTDCNETSQTANGADYRGCQNTTINGYTCQRWDSQTPQVHTFLPSKYPLAGLDGNNYCRSPDGYKNLWCYTTDPDVRWDSCQPLTNFACSNAISVGCGQSVQGSTNAVVHQGSFNCPGMRHTSPQVWYSLELDQEAFVTISTCTAAWDTKISVFGGDCGNLTCEASDDDSCGFASKVVRVLQPGTWYIMVHGYSSQTGPFTLDVACDSKSSRVTNWTRVFKCDYFEDAVDRLDFTPEVVKQLAETASTVKICGYGEVTYCEESLANAFPIQMLRQGFPLSHWWGLPCTADCASQVWTGPVPGLMWTSAAIDNRTTWTSSNGMLFAAWGNTQGLYLSTSDYGLCTWASPTPTLRFEMFIDTQMAVSKNCGNMSSTGSLYTADGLEGVMSVDLLVKITGTSGKGVPTFGNSYGDAWGVYFFPGGVYTSGSDGRTWSYPSGPDPTDGSWHRITLSANVLYVDAVAVMPDMLNHLADASDFWVGWRSTQPRMASVGSLEVKDIRLYSVSLDTLSSNVSSSAGLMAYLQPQTGNLRDLANPLVLWSTEGMPDPLCQVHNDRTSNVAGCTTFQIYITTSDYPAQMGWGIRGSKPPIGVQVGTYVVPYKNVTFTGCLLPGNYTFTVVDYGRGWKNGTYTVAIGNNVLIAHDGVSDEDRSQTFTIPASTGVCFINAPDCHHDAYCIDDDAGGTCQCLPGYIGDGVTSCRSPDEAPEEANPNPSCIDLPDWKDRNGYTCADYTSMGWCSNWWYGDGWSRSWGIFGDYAAKDSVGADAACCNCGLARRPKTQVDCVLGEWGNWTDCTAVGETKCEQTRKRSVLIMPNFGKPCDSLTETQPCQGCPQCHTVEWNDWTCVAKEVHLRSRLLNSSSFSSPAPPCPELGEVVREKGVCQSSVPMPSGPVLQMSGSNQDGQLGLLNVTQETTLKLLGDTISLMPVISVALGGYHTAVIVGTALLRQVFVTGLNTYGQLGLGDTVQRKTYTLLPIPGSSKGQVLSVALGYYHTMVITNEGLLYTCGAGGFGQLGLRSNDNSYVLQQVQSVISAGTQNTPINGINISLLAAGGYHSAFLTVDGAPYLFGRGSFGQLGHNNRQSQNAPKRVIFFARRQVITAVALGLYHSAFITSADELYVSGDNSKSQLGLPSLGTYIEPQLLGLFSGTGIKQVALGFSHSVVLLTNGSVYAFGDTYHSQTNFINDSVPQQITFPPGVSIAKIATGWYTTAAIDDARGDLFTWGDNTYGQGGLGSVIQALIPEEVETQDSAGPVIHVAAGAAHLAVLRLGTLTPTGTLTISLSSTISHTQTTSATSSSSTSVSASPIQTTSASPTPIITLSATSTGTSSASRTSPPTLTPSFATCGLANVSLTSGHWTLMSVASCMQIIQLGPGSTSLTKRSIGVNLLAVPAPIRLAILEGCGSGSDDDACRWHLTSADAGRKLTLPLGATQNGLLSVFYGAGGVTQYRAGGSSVQVEFFTEYRCTSTLLIPVCVATAVGAALLVGAGWWGIRKHRSHRPCTKDWSRNQRLEYMSIQTAIALGAWGILTGVAWCVFVVSTSHPTSQPIGLIIAGALLAGIGTLLALLPFLWAMQDPHQFDCIACHEPVSRWRFHGTYLPDPNDPLLHCKAHTQHILCVSCNKPVIDDCWPEAPPQYRYHTQCWDALCTLVVNDPSEVSRWVAQQKAIREPTETELVHMLAAAVKHSAMDTVTQLMSISPSLPSAVISQDGGWTALHLAVQEGKLQVLELLLQSEPPCLDPICSPDPNCAPSLSITGLEEGNDVYVVQPLLTFNDHAVYFGHVQGWYLYYYDPDNDDSKVRYAEGWCLSPHLGSGTPKWRIPLSEDTDEPRLKSHEIEGVQQMMGHHPHLQRGRQWIQTHRRWSRYTFLPTRHHKQGRGHCGIHSLDDDYSSAHAAQYDAPRKSATDGPCKDYPPTAPPPSPAMLDDMQAEDLKRRESALLHVQAEFPPNVQIELLPHIKSLLEQAILSANPETVRYVVHLYQIQDPKCVNWQYYTSHGLWEPFSAAAQAEIWGVMTQGKQVVTLHNQEFSSKPMSLDLARKICWDSKGERPIQSVFQAIFQHRQSNGDPFEVTSDAAVVLNRKGAVVVIAPGHIPLSTSDPDILELLVKEGVVHFASWRPPSKMGGAVPEMDVIHQKIFYTLMNQVIVQMMSVTDDVMMAVHSSSVDPGRVRSGRVETGLGNRLTDGLEQDQGNDQVPFYAPDYTSDEGTMPFCAKLPENQLGLKFALVPIVQMGMDAVLKLHELQRQHFPQKACHIIAVYVYSYELSYEDQGYDQIYGAMNKAMRLRIKNLIEFWRPFIWEIDVALQAFPSFKGKCYRGINCEISPSQYQNGTTICWPSFSSASQNQAVAEEFAKGETGTLFFLTSVSARPISEVSRYPEEAEVLFPPNSVFQITSTLFGTSEIGSFYGRVDNVAMAEATGEVSPVSVPGVVPRVRVAGHTSFLLHIPSEVTSRILDFLSEVGILVMEGQSDKDDSGIAGELLIATELAGIP